MSLIDHEDGTNRPSLRPIDFNDVSARWALMTQEPEFAAASGDLSVIQQPDLTSADYEINEAKIRAKCFERAQQAARGIGEHLMLFALGQQESFAFYAQNEGLHAQTHRAFINIFDLPLKFDKFGRVADVNDQSFLLLNMGVALQLTTQRYSEDGKIHGLQYVGIQLPEIKSVAT